MKKGKKKKKMDQKKFVAIDFGTNNFMTCIDEDGDVLRIDSKKESKQVIDMMCECATIQNKIKLLQEKQQKIIEKRNAIISSLHFRGKNALQFYINKNRDTATCFLVGDVRCIQKSLQHIEFVKRKFSNLLVSNYR